MNDEIYCKDCSKFIIGASPISCTTCKAQFKKHDYPFMIFVAIALLVIGYVAPNLMDIPKQRAEKAYISDMGNILCAAGDGMICSYLDTEVEESDQNYLLFDDSKVATNFDSTEHRKILNQIQEMDIPNKTFYEAHEMVDESLGLWIQQAEEIKEYATLTQDMLIKYQDEFFDKRSRGGYGELSCGFLGLATFSGMEIRRSESYEQFFNNPWVKEMSAKCTGLISQKMVLDIAFGNFLQLALRSQIHEDSLKARSKEREGLTFRSYLYQAPWIEESITRHSN